MDKYEIIQGECTQAMADMPEESVDAIVTDPPYGLGFMGASWDSFNGLTGSQTIAERKEEGIRYAANNDGAPRYGNSHGKKVTHDEMVAFQEHMEPIFVQALRVAKPGAHLLCFGGTRTFHRLMCAIEDAGWEIRDTIMWVKGNSFPHGMNIGRKLPEWEGWNTQLKPSWEPIVVARKPVVGTIVNNVQTYGTGAINVDACRVPTNDRLSGGMKAGGSNGVWDRPFMHDEEAQKAFVERKVENVARAELLGRYPANLVHDGSDEVLALFPESKGQHGDVRGTEPSAPCRNTYGDFAHRTEFQRRGDTGSAARFFNAFREGEAGADRTYSDKGSTNFSSKPGMRREPTSTDRFFYCATASKKDRNFGCEDYLTWEQDQELTMLLEKSNQRLKDICAFGTPKAEDLSLFTELFGNEQTVLSQTEWSFITSTVTRLTTDLRTSSSSQRSNINESILDAIRTSEESGISVVQLAEKLSQSKQDSTNGKTDTATSAVVALFDALSEIRKLARKGNLHPTIKPNALMRWLVRLVCRKDGIVLDPFMGSGSTGVACMDEGMRFIGIELEGEYVGIAERRLREATMQSRLF